MYRPFKFTETEESQIFFTSDTHFGHDKEFIWKDRGFNSVEEHDEGMIESWNDTVRPTDLVIHLGDFVVGVGKNPEPYCRSVLSRLNGDIIYLWGNHNAGMKNIYRGLMLDNVCTAEQYDNDKWEFYPLYVPTANGSLTFRGHYLYLQVKDLDGRRRDLFCSHYAHRLWLDSHRGKVMHLSGHSHGSDPESQPLATSPRRMDVGIDNFGGPISLADVVLLMKRKTVTQIDHHDSETNLS